MGAMFMFIFTFCVSAYGIYYDNQRKSSEIESEEGYQISSGNQAEYGSRYDDTVQHFIRKIGEKTECI